MRIYFQIIFEFTWNASSAVSVNKLKMKMMMMMMMMMMVMMMMMMMMMTMMVIRCHMRAHAKLFALSICGHVSGGILFENSLRVDPFSKGTQGQ